MLLALFITVLVTSTAYGMIRALKIPKVQLDSDVSVGVKQLSDYLMTGVVESHNVELVYKDRENQEFRVFLNDHRLVKTPGYETLIMNIDEISFFEENDFLFIRIKRGHREFEYLIGDLYEKNSREIEEEREEEIPQQ